MTTLTVVDRADLEVVVAVAEAGSVTAAADRLHLAQPAVSRRLTNLEREIGTALFHRGRHGAVPTPAGLALLPQAALTLDAFRRTERAARDAAAGRLGTVRVATTPTLGADVLPPVLAGAHAAFPTVRIELATSGDSVALQEAVRDGAADLAVVVLDPRPVERVEVRAHGRQDFALVLPADHPLGRGATVPRRSIAREPIVAPRVGSGLRIVLDALFAELDAEPDIVLEADERELLVPMVAAGLGLTLLPQIFATARATPGVVIRPLRPAVARHIGAVVRPGTDQPVVAALLEGLHRHGLRPTRPRATAAGRS